MKMCVLGAGSIGKRHLRLLGERDDITLSVVEPLEDSWNRLTAELGMFERFESLDKVIEDGSVDAVIIAAPHRFHAELAVKAMKAGLHVFCEKPMSDSLDCCVEMLHTAKQCNTVFSVGFMFHFDPIVKKVKDLLSSGAVGTLLSFSGRFATLTTLRCSVTRHQRNVPYSIVMDNIHDTDLLCWLTGRIPDTVSVNAVQVGDMELTSNPNVVDISYGYANKDFIANEHMNYLQHPQIHTLELVGDRGYIQAEFKGKTAANANSTGTLTYVNADGIIDRMEFAYDFDDVYRAEWDSFIKAVKGECKPENPAELAILPTLLMEAQKVAGTTGERVSVREIAEKYGFFY